MPICNHCGLPKEEEEFNWRWKNLGIRQSCCKTCQQEQRRSWYEGSAKERHKENVHARKRRVRDEAREYVVSYLSEHPCVECGEDDPVVLEFHHRDGDEKERAISELIGGGYSIETIQKEIDKCDVMCANCHRKKTMRDRGWYRGRQ